MLKANAFILQSIILLPGRLVLRRTWSCSAAGVFGLLLLAGCSSDSAPPVGPFSLSAATGELNLLEGDATGLNIPFSVSRDADHTAPVTVSLAGFSAADVESLSSQFISNELTVGDDQSSVNLKLTIDTLPILPQQRSYRLSATDGTFTSNSTIIVNVTPTSAPDVYLLAGQSNMVGFGGDGDKNAAPGGPDEPNERIKQLNITKNSEADVFNTPESWTNTASIATAIEGSYIVRAEDPLHVPADPFTKSKEDTYIGLGLRFAKNALPNTSQDIILVPAAFSASAFCQSALVGGNWNARSTNNENLGNTHLYDRAVARTNLTLQESGGILRGILWHQGESDTDGAPAACGDLYEQNLVLLASSFRNDIITDARGGSARGESSDVPFVVGTMSRGINSNGDYSVLSASKQKIDNAHRSVTTLVPHSALSNHDDLVPPAYPCGNTSCVHFGSAALRVMGARYYAALVRAALTTE